MPLRRLIVISPPFLSLVTLTPGARLLIGMAIGDAFGARFENLKRGEINLSGEEQTYRDRNHYTDDTQMAVGVAELLVSGSPITEENLADALLATYRRDPRPGYSAITRRMLEESATGKDFLCSLSEEEIKSRKSDGAAMRALPLGMLAEKREVVRSAQLSAGITHGHPDSLSATVGIALIAHERYHRKRPFSEIVQELPFTIPSLTPAGREYLTRVITTEWSPETILHEYESYGVPYTESIILLGAVISILATFGEEPHRALLESVQLGGDTDTTASLVLGAALIHPGGETLPPGLLSDLENGDYGRDFLKKLGDKLSIRFPVTPI